MEGTPGGMTRLQTALAIAGASVYFCAMLFLGIYAMFGDEGFWNTVAGIVALLMFVFMMAG